MRTLGSFDRLFAMTAATRFRNVAIFLAFVTSGAAGYYLIAGRQPAKVHTHADSAPAQKNASTALPVIHVERSVDIKRQPKIQPTENLTSPPLDSATIVHCHWAFVGSQPIGRSNCEDPKSSLGMRQCQELQITDVLHNQTMRGEAAACPASLATASGYYDALRAAAQAGDVGAQRCFIQGYFDDPQGRDRISEQQRRDYIHLANNYISSGLQRGDWSLAQWLARVSLHVPDGLLFSAYPFGSSALETLYKMNFLLTLGGATDTDTQRPQSIVKNVAASGELSEQQVQDAQEWARETHSKYFAATPYTSTSVESFCPSTSVP